MKKVKTLFERGEEGKVIPQVTSGSEWVINGEGLATRKYDGTCCLIEGGKFFKRYTLRDGHKAPEGFKAVTDKDPNTGKTMGWVPVLWDAPENRYHIKGYANGESKPDGTYELIGERIQGNPEGVKGYKLIRHADAEKYPDFPRDYEGIRDALSHMQVEGIVWHHEDGRMVKIKTKDFKK